MFVFHSGEHRIVAFILGKWFPNCGSLISSESGDNSYHASCAKLKGYMWNSSPKRSQIRTLCLITQSENIRYKMHVQLYTFTKPYGFLRNWTQLHLQCWTFHKQSSVFISEDSSMLCGIRGRSWKQLSSYNIVKNILSWALICCYSGQISAILRLDGRKIHGLFCIFKHTK